MKRLLILGIAILMSCTATPSQKSSDMQGNVELLVSESQGGTDQVGFKIIKNEQEFRNSIKGSFGLVELKKEPSVNYPKFPKNKKVIFYQMGSFRSGSHRVTSIKNVSVKNNILYVEIPAVESGGMEIQMLSNPWFIFAVPSDYQFTSVELKYSN
ncbi:hypothetical protein [Chryseobacterium vrystaatense]|uniref:PrcB C-terminal n=1 Tax=Chryseobacterium vrystaatense TaxID=307480 RepID=A0A1M5A9U1_9FLAO|nr:hypothetical protein [Chryseobacterium vrystaatense]KFF27072.1 hypothetical protein IW16_07365 [Chryseobacterium vrystaatense]SHF26914.1 hypothetical protein SAMN02787073_1848 [Chryseobacterium vrystaatense]